MVVPYFMDNESGYSFGDDDGGISFSYEASEDKRYLVVLKKEMSPNGSIDTIVTVFSKGNEAKAKEFCRQKLVTLIGEDKFNQHKNCGWIRQNPYSQPHQAKV